MIARIGKAIFYAAATVTLAYTFEPTAMSHKKIVEPLSFWKLCLVSLTVYKHDYGSERLRENCDFVQGLIFFASLAVHCGNMQLKSTF